MNMYQTRQQDDGLSAAAAGAVPVGGSVLMCGDVTAWPGFVTCEGVRCCGALCVQEPMMKVTNVCRDDGAGKFCMRGTTATKDMKVCGDAWHAQSIPHEMVQDVVSFSLHWHLSTSG